MYGQLAAANDEGKKVGKVVSSDSMGESLNYELNIRPFIALANQMIRVFEESERFADCGGVLAQRQCRCKPENRYCRWEPPTKEETDQFERRSKYKAPFIDQMDFVGASKKNSGAKDGPF